MRVLEWPHNESRVIIKYTIYIYNAGPKIKLAGNFYQNFRFNSKGKSNETGGLQTRPYNSIFAGRGNLQKLLNHLLSN